MKFGLARGITRLTVGIIAVSSLFNMGCSRRTLQDGAALAQYGSDTAASLVNYYDGLHNRADKIVIVANYSAAGPASDSQVFNERLKALTDDINASSDALEARAEMALKCKEVFDALHEMATRDTVAPVKKSISGLVNAITDKKTGLNRHPFLISAGGGSLGGADVINELVKNLLILQQTNDLRKNAPEITAVATQLLQFFESEKAANENFAVFYEDNARNMLKDLNENDMLVLAPGLQRIADGYDAQVNTQVAGDFHKNIIKPFSAASLNSLHDEHVAKAKSQSDAILKRLKILQSNCSLFQQRQKLTIAFNGRQKSAPELQHVSVTGSATDEQRGERYVKFGH